MTEAQVEDGQFLFDVGGHRYDQRGVADLVDRRPGKAGYEVARQPITQLSVHVVRVEHRPGELGPGVGVFVGQAGATDDADGVTRDPGQLVGDLRKSFCLLYTSDVYKRQTMA